MKKNKIENLINKLSDQWADDGMCAPKEYYIKQLKKLVRLVKNEKE